MLKANEQPQDLMHKSLLSHLMPSYLSWTQKPTSAHVKVFSC